MEVTKFLHMNGADKETSYAKNSGEQNIILTRTKSIRQSLVADFFTNELSLHIADLGCSSGPNALVPVSDMIEAVTVKCQAVGRAVPDFFILLNDLHLNDFNSVFALLPEFYEKIQARCFVHGVPGSFYGRLFANNSVHIFHSSMSLHWLSKVPRLEEEGSNVQLNKGNVCISKNSHPSVVNAYLTQFQRDFSLFLKCRYEEMATGGRMLLTFHGRRQEDAATDHDRCNNWHMLSETLRDLASQGSIKEEEIDTFNIPIYMPCPEEVRNVIIQHEYFDIDILDTFEMKLESVEDDNKIFASVADRVVKSMRAVCESMLEFHFGKKVMDELFERYHHKCDGYFSKNIAKVTNLIVSVVKKH